jgi:hypothetical protein
MYIRKPIYPLQHPMNAWKADAILLRPPSMRESFGAFHKCMLTAPLSRSVLDAAAQRRTGSTEYQHNQGIQAGSTRRGGSAWVQGVDRLPLTLAPTTSRESGRAPPSRTRATATARSDVRICSGCGRARPRAPTRRRCLSFPRRHQTSRSRCAQVCTLAHRIFRTR